MVAPHLWNNPCFIWINWNSMEAGMGRCRRGDTRHEGVRTQREPTPQASHGADPALEPRIITKSGQSPIEYKLSCWKEVVTLRLSSPHTHPLLTARECV
ncbi:hypothetical protein SAMN05192552_1008144 [Natrinema hispanicum]|uniref:Uncharacterized protein n=1 Tax=Natrinema hispanicum TaxID=392421 RepID=A0A1G6Q6L1_9EURY|nr:hypothetical protein SAMN05192552_1008144 [Natrinema hispanicum]SET29481.1 hypothetical protein SAMN04488694_10589 [Natrinema hispanicum]